MKDYFMYGLRYLVYTFTIVKQLTFFTQWAKYTIERWNVLIE